MHSRLYENRNQKRRLSLKSSPGPGRLRSFFLTSKTKIYYELLLAPPTANFSTYDSQG